MKQVEYGWRKWIAGPIIWQVFIVYCLVFGIILFTSLGKSGNIVIPLVFVTSFVLLRFHLPVLTPGKTRRNAVRFAQCTMIVAALFGAFYRRLSPEYVFAGVIYPYHFLRPLFDVVMPLSWAALLASPSMLTWILESESSSSDDLRYSVADLLFFMAVTSFGMLLWLAFKTR